MIEIKVSLDSVDGDEDQVMFKCDWRFVSEETTDLERKSAGFILSRIEDAIKDVSLTALLNGGAVQDIGGEDSE